MAATIAICDDDQSFVELTTRYLVFHGYSVWSAEDPAGFTARALEEPPDVLLLDMQMRGGGGPQALAAIRECPELKNLKVIMCSGMPVEQMALWAEGMAGVKYLAKPFDTRRLGQLLEEIVPKAAFIAFTRAVSPQMARCELTHLERSVIDVKRAAAQHEAYEKALSKAGCDVRRLSAAPDLPDSVFVEDAAVVFDELAVIARPGAETRRGEVVEVEKALSGLRHLEKIESPGTLDGGDVLVAGKRVFAGRTARTNDEGIRQLGLLLAPRGYVVAAVPVTGCLHLKSAVTAFDENSLLINSKWVPRDAFPGFDLLEIDPSEPYAANVLKLGETLIMPSAFPKTRARLEREWKKPVIVDADELAKAEGAVTCCSLIAARRPGEPRAGC